MSIRPEGSLDRRTVLVGAGAVFGFVVAGCEKKITPKQAREQAASLQVLTEAEQAVIDAIGSRLVPGATEAGLSHYLDVQLNAGAADQMLMIKYLGLEYPFTDFYKQGLAAISRSARSRFDREFVELTTQEIDAFVAAMSANEVSNWEGPPAPFFFFVLRSDAVDVSYGTRDGFDKLGVPYMAHIEPPSDWGA
ncbi:MAG: gluconate 2-dehydrogenase subunit 3 family protein [Pseudomonadota bacterium]